MCPDCRNTLISAPALCSGCGGVSCPPEQSCMRPWIADSNRESGIRSFTARYLAVGPGYQILKRWKSRRGHTLAREILSSGLPIDLKTVALVPVPQNFFRSWSLGGSPALDLAHWLSRASGIPLWNPLAPEKKESGGKQSLRSLERRLSAPPRFSFHSRISDRPRGPLLLVDDFMTTGETLRAAALALRQSGRPEIHCYVLGLRPQLKEGSGAGSETVEWRDSDRLAV